MNAENAVRDFKYYIDNDIPVVENISDDDYIPEEDE